MRRFVLVVLLCLISKVSLAQEAAPSSQAWLEKNADQPYIALVNEYETIVKSDWSYEEKYHSRVKIQQEAGKELGEWPIYYNKSRDAITDIKAVVENPDGKQLTATDIQDLPVYKDYPMYSDMRMKVVNLPQVTVGSVIDVTVRSTTTHKEIPNQYWAEVLIPAIPTQEAKHLFIFPDDKTINFKAYKMDYKPTITKSNGQTQYSILFNQTNALPDQEVFMPPLQDVLGALYLSSMDDWKTIADWYRALADKNTVDDAQITVKALEVTRVKATAKDKARAILEFIQDNFKYVPINLGDGIDQLHQTTETFNNHYGDSKDLTLLMRQMLKLVGIDSNICFLSVEFAGDPQAGYPNPSVFSNAILQVSLGDELYFVDPQLKGFDFGQYPPNYDNAHVMIIDSNGFKFDHLPIASDQDRTLTSQADIAINPDGSADFRVHVELSVESSQNFRQSWMASSNEDKDKFFDKLEQNFAKNGKLIDRKVLGVENRYGPVQFDLRYQSPNSYPVINDMIIIKEEDQSDLPSFQEPQRRTPVFVPNNSMIKNINTYHVPEGFKVSFVPANYSMSIDLMDAQVSYENAEKSVKITSIYKTKRSVTPPERYAQLRDFRKELFKNSDQYIILKKSSEISSQAKDWVKSQ